ncbi:MAG: JAB domain-containing protein [Lachnospiraceae bacterium]|nr:JAB domain-containing protein [Lachnospiraceae bacterium]
MNNFSEVRIKLVEDIPMFSDTQIQTPEDAVSAMKEVLKDLDREHVIVVNLNNINQPINFNTVSIGTCNRSLCWPANILKSALLSNATRIMLFHNHPSGGLTPSSYDFEITKNIINAANLLGIEVLDHIIVSGFSGNTYSFKMSNPELFPTQNNLLCADQPDERNYYFSESTETSEVHEDCMPISPEIFMVRPTYQKFGVYQIIGSNRAEVVFEGTEDECWEKIKEFRDKTRKSMVL